MSVDQENVSNDLCISVENGRSVLAPSHSTTSLPTTRVQYVTNMTLKDLEKNVSKKEWSLFDDFHLFHYYIYTKWWLGTTHPFHISNPSPTRIIHLMAQGVNADKDAFKHKHLAICDATASLFSKFSNLLNEHIDLDGTATRGRLISRPDLLPCDRRQSLELMLHSIMEYFGQYSTELVLRNCLYEYRSLAQPRVSPQFLDLTMPDEVMELVWKHAVDDGSGDVKFKSFANKMCILLIILVLKNNKETIANLVKLIDLLQKEEFALCADKLRKDIMEGCSCWLVHLGLFRQPSSLSQKHWLGRHIMTCITLLTHDRRPIIPNATGPEDRMRKILADIAGRFAASLRTCFTLWDMQEHLTQHAYEKIKTSLWGELLSSEHMYLYAPRVEDGRGNALRTDAPIFGEITYSKWYQRLANYEWGSCKFRTMTVATNHPHKLVMLFDKYTALPCRESCADRGYYETSSTPRVFARDRDPGPACRCTWYTRRNIYHPGDPVPRSTQYQVRDVVCQPHGLLPSEALQMRLVCKKWSQDPCLSMFLPKLQMACSADRDLMPLLGRDPTIGIPFARNNKESSMLCIPMKADTSDLHGRVISHEGIFDWQQASSDACGKVLTVPHNSFEALFPHKTAGPTMPHFVNSRNIIQFAAVFKANIEELSGSPSPYDSDDVRPGSIPQQYRKNLMSTTTGTRSGILRWLNKTSKQYCDSALLDPYTPSIADFFANMMSCPSKLDGVVMCIRFYATGHITEHNLHGLDVTDCLRKNAKVSGIRTHTSPCADFDSLKMERGICGVTVTFGVTQSYIAKLVREARRMARANGDHSIDVAASPSDGDLVAVMQPLEERYRHMKFLYAKTQPFRLARSQHEWALTDRFYRP